MQKLVELEFKDSDSVFEISWAIQTSGKLCLSSGSGGWSAPREAAAKKQKLPPLQLYNLNSDRAERNNLIIEHPEKVESLLKKLNAEVVKGRSTPGDSAKNDRKVSFLPSGVKMPK